MSQGKPSGVPLDPEHLGPFAQELADLDDRGRFAIPSRIASLTTWLSTPPWPKDGLLTLLSWGTAILSDFQVNGPEIVRRRREAIAQSADDREMLNVVAAIEDRYHRILIPASRRITLGSAVIVHLSEGLNRPVQLYVETLSERILILTPQARSRRLEQFASLFADLD